jgi:hypothetical protein
VAVVVNTGLCSQHGTNYFSTLREGNGAWLGTAMGEDSAVILCINCRGQQSKPGPARNVVIKWLHFLGVCAYLRACICESKTFNEHALRLQLLPV